MALRSMTGFGSAEGELSARVRAAVRVTSVNARFLEVSVRTQPRLDTSEWEPMVRSRVAERVTRGRVSIALNLEAQHEAGGVAAVNWGVVEALVAALERRPAGIALAPLSLRDLLGIPGFLAGGGELELDQAERDRLLDLVRQACSALRAEREREGEALRVAMEADLAALEAFVAWLRGERATMVNALMVRLRQRLAEVLAEAAVSEERLVQEAALLAERADVTEEVARLAAHLAHLRRLLATDEPVGKRLEFLLQEVLREVNTAAAKCREVGMGERVVAAKAAVERLREQAANLE